MIFWVDLWFFIIGLFNSFGLWEGGVINLIVLPFYCFMFCNGSFSFINKSFLKMSLLLLSFWVFQYMLVCNKILKGSLFFYCCICLLVVVVIFFCGEKSMTFYVFFELSLIPTLMMVFFFGYQPEKLQAGMYLLMYTVFSSLPLLLVFLSNKVYMIFMSHELFWWYSLIMTLGFSVKTPLYMVHVWLPKAHVEAPVAGSMVLAGILLKLGSYGFMLFCPHLKNSILMLYVYLSLLGAIYCSLICLRNFDMKSLIAYSSVVHMGVVTVGVVSGSEIGYKCALMMVIAHGVCSPFLFSLAYYLYMSSHSRVISCNKGFVSLPVMVFLGFILLAVNMGVPPSINLWSEVLMFFSLIELMKNAIFFLFLIAFLGVIYNLFMYVSVSQSKESFYEKGSVEVGVWPFFSSVVLSFMIWVSVSFF